MINPHPDSLAALLLERHGRANMTGLRIDHDILWEALMVCGDCPHRMIDHDEVAMRCRKCRCDQSARGLSSLADERLLALGGAIREARSLAALQEEAAHD